MVEVLEKQNTNVVDEKQYLNRKKSALFDLSLV